MSNSRRLPATSTEWYRALAAESGGQSVPAHISRIPKLNSGSKLQRAEFLQLQVLWEVAEQHFVDFDILFQDPARAKEDARQTLASFPWYRSAREDSQDFRAWQAMGLWKKSAVNIVARQHIPLKHEENMMRRQGNLQDPFKLIILEPPSSNLRSRPWAADRTSPAQSRASSTSSTGQTSPDEGGSGSSGSRSQDSSSSYRAEVNPRNPDEQIVNEALLRLLEGISLYDEGSNRRLEWSSTRKAFSVQQGDIARNETLVKVMTALTDGCLQRIPGPGTHPEDMPTYAILEAKAFRRGAHLEAIQMQEGAEMAAWISSQPRKGHYQKFQGVYRRIIISQDLDEVYITFAEYDDEYIKYIQGIKGSGGSSPRSSSPPSPPSGGYNSGAGTQKPPAGAPGASKTTPPRSSVPPRPLPPQTPVTHRPRRDPVAPKAPHHGVPPSSTSISSPSGKGTIDPNRKSFGSDGSTGSLGNTGGFLKMHQFREFRLHKRDDMLRLFELLVALMHSIDHQVQLDEMNPLK